MPVAGSSENQVRASSRFVVAGESWSGPIQPVASSVSRARRVGSEVVAGDGEEVEADEHGRAGPDGSGQCGSAGGEPLLEAVEVEAAVSPDHGLPVENGAWRELDAGGGGEVGKPGGEVLALP